MTPKGKRKTGLNECGRLKLRSEIWDPRLQIGSSPLGFLAISSPIPAVPQSAFPRDRATLESATMTDTPDKLFTIRSFRSEDLAACRTLYREGLISGKIAENDTGLDIDDIESAYMNCPGCHFWVAENAEGQVVGMIGVQQHESDIGEVRRLRVQQDQRRKGIGSALIETALRFCQEQQYLKVHLDTFMEREPAINLFRKFRFHHAKTRQVLGKDLMYFYLDLYTSDRRPKQE